MGEHITQDGKFRSDKYRVIRIADGEDVSDDKLVLSFHDPEARDALLVFANDTPDTALAADIYQRVDMIDR